MQTRSIESIVREEQPTQMSLVIPNPDWAYFSPSELPEPIRDWLDANAPGTVVEKVTGLESKFGRCLQEPLLHEFAMDERNSIYWLKLTPDQAHQLSEDWDKQHPEAEANDFFFLTFELPTGISEGWWYFLDMPPEAEQGLVCIAACAPKGEGAIMKSRSFDAIVREEELTGTMCLVVPNPNWDQYHPTDLPLPILEWITANAPGGAVERVTDFGNEFAYLAADPQLDEFVWDERGAVFWLRLTPDQADRFAEDWSRQHPDTGTTDFFLLTVEVPSYVPECWQFDYAPPDLQSGATTCGAPNA